MLGTTEALPCRPSLPPHRCRIPEALGVRHQKYLYAGGVARPCEHDLVREGHREPSAVLGDRTLMWVGRRAWMIRLDHL